MGINEIFLIREKSTINEGYTNKIAYISAIFFHKFSSISVCFINFHEYANSTICMIDITVKLLGPYISIRLVIVFQNMLLLVYEYFCDDTLFFRITLGAGWKLCKFTS